MLILNLFEGLIDGASELGIFANMDKIINCSVNCFGCFLFTNVFEKIVNKKCEIFMGEYFNKIPDKAQKFKIYASFELHILLLNNVCKHFFNIFFFEKTDSPFHFWIHIQ